MRAPALTLQPGTDYVTDVQWSPVHPTLIGATDASGGLHVFDFLQNADRPLVSCSPTKKGLTALHFSPSGSAVAVGDSGGALALIHLPAKVCEPRGDESQRLLHSTFAY